MAPKIEIITCRIFRTHTDAEITKKIYQRVPVLDNEKTGSNPWNIKFMTIFHMSNDSDLFKTKSDNDTLPLYEAKIFYLFDHRSSTYEGASQAQLNVGILPPTTDEMKQNPNFAVQPNYWVSRTEVENRIRENWKKEWLLAFRGITNATNERCAFFSLLPKVGVGNSAPILLLGIDKTSLVSCLLANLSSLVFDFVDKQKVGGTNFNFFIVISGLKPEQIAQHIVFSPDGQTIASKGKTVQYGSKIHFSILMGT